MVNGSFTQTTFFGLCPSTKLKKHDVSEAGYISIFR